MPNAKKRVWIELSKERQLIDDRSHTSPAYSWRILEGLDPTTMTELAQCRVFGVDMGNTEAQIRGLLSRAKFFDIACEFGIGNLSTSLISQVHE